LIADSDTKAGNINVETSNGKVTLTGTAKTWQESDKAAQIARGIKGVTGVENDIRVQ
jgi:osmotically-inducible protein OsmY